MAGHRILIIDDEDAIRQVLRDSLEDDGFNVTDAEDGEHGLQKIKELDPEIVLLDIWMPGSMDGIEVLTKAKASHCNSQFIVMSGHGTIETAVRAVKLGAWDFVEKPLSMDKITILINNILTYQQERAEKTALLNRLRRNIALVGDAPEMKSLKQMIARIAPTASWLLITGENGTGKELVAQNIHYMSPRASRAFVDVTCSALPPDLVEAELFGFEKGAFTGAERGKPGKLDLADGGTLFLDEIADIGLDSQAKILKVLQERSFVRFGGSSLVEVDVRLVVATSKDLETEVKEGRFLEDLYYRLNVIPFEVPALRKRQEDIPALISHFSDLFAREGGYSKKIFSEKAMDKMLRYPWPGNVRELKNFIERIYILTPGEFVDVHDLRFAGLVSKQSPDDALPDELSTFREARSKFEKDYLLRKISENNGNISKTAEVIGLERSYLHRKIKAYGIDV